MKYSLNNVLWTPQEFIRLVCTRWETLDEAIRRFEWLRLESLKTPDARDLVATWLLEHYGENTQKVTIEEAGLESDNRRRRCMFWAIRPERCFPKLQPTKVDEVNRTVTRTYWDDEGVAELREVHQHYVLWRVSGDKLGVDDPVTALQCWCPTTNKEFWIMQPTWTNTVDAALQHMYDLPTYGEPTGDIYRHGDILFERVSDENQERQHNSDALEKIQAET